MKDNDLSEKEVRSYSQVPSTEGNENLGNELAAVFSETSKRC